MAEREGKEEAKRLAEAKGREEEGVAAAQVDSSHDETHVIETKFVRMKCLHVNPPRPLMAR